MAKNINRAELLGNVVRDAEYKVTAQNTPICTFAVATNRSWKTSLGEAKEDVDFHRIVAWQKLAEICGQLIKKGTKVYVEGRMSNKKLEDGTYSHEIVADDVIVLDKRLPETELQQVASETTQIPEEEKKIN